MKSCLQLASILVLAFFSMSFTQPDDGTVRDRKSVIALLDSVENIMDDDAPYAGSLVKLIDPHSLKTKKLKARYALLYTAVEYKNYQPFTSDSLIMEAVNYYSKKRNIDYRFLSYYYLGCVYMELGRMKDASKALTQADILSDRIENDFWKGLLFARLAFIYRKFNNFNYAENYSNKAYLCFDNVGKEDYKYKSLLNYALCKMDKNQFKEAVPLFQEIQAWAAETNDSVFCEEAIYQRFACYLYLDEIDNATLLYDDYISKHDCIINYVFYYVYLAWYFDQIKDYSKSDFYLDEANKCSITPADSIYWLYFNSILTQSRGDVELYLQYHKKYTYLQNEYARNTLLNPILGVQKEYIYTLAELDAIKARNRITILVASIIIIILIVFSITVYSRNKRREFENQISDYISTINELTTQISINQDKIGNLNAKVREMLRQQFNSSDYLYTRYYEQIEDSKKAERLYRVVKNQLDGFTTPKNINHIDELLDEAFDGIMTKLTSSGLEIKEKDMLLLRFALAGFSAKSIAALLDETHQNINQRKKRVLDKIQNNAPVLMEDLRIALDSK